MKRIPPFLVAALASALSFASAPTAQQEAFVPDSVTSAGVGQLMPFGLPGFASVRFQEIFPAANLPNQPIRITALGVSRVLPGVAFSAQQVQVRMGHTTVGLSPSTTFATNIGAFPTVLADESAGYTFDAPLVGWGDLPLTGSFGYDGVRDICFEFRYRGTASTVIALGAAFGALPRIYSVNAPDNYAATSGIAQPSGGLKFRLTYTTANVLLASDSVQLGNNATVTLHGVQPGANYAIAASFGQSPQTILGYTVRLDDDALFRLSLSGLAPTLFQGYVGVADKVGTATATLSVPAVPALAGLAVYHAAITFGSNGDATNTASTALVP